MEFAFVPVISLLVPGLTLFSGIGLGSILKTVMALFFPVDVVIAVLIIAASLATFLGVVIGKKLVKHVTMVLVRKCVAVSLIVLSLALGSGVM
ncbi:MAG: hypothetical protein ACE5GH_02865 [Fidelibacterota bacterium]